MSMTVNFYGINKRENSTRIPTGTGISREVVLKSETSILNPVFELNWNNNNPAIYNYCYCQEFTRYYYIRDWVYTGRMWNAVCECDEMASFKTSILNARLYVLRSASEYDLNVSDSIYPTKCDPTVHYENGIDIGLQSPDSVGSGRFIVTTVTRDTHTISPTGLTYYALTAAEMNLMRNGLFPDLTSVLNNRDKVADIPAILMCNPLQYIQSVMWIPFVPDCSYVSQIYLGYFNVLDTGDFNTIGICNGLTHTISVSDIAIPKPDTTRGNWLKYEPYTQYFLYCPYFGTIKLPSEIVAKYDTFGVTIAISLVTGAACLKCFAGYSPNATPFIIKNAQIGQSIQLAGAGENWGAIFNGLSGVVGGTVGGLFSESPGGAVNSVLNLGLSGVKMAYGTFTPIPESVGMAGGATELNTRLSVFTVHYDITDEDLAHFGRPLCKVRRIGDLSGFCQVADGYDIDTRATPAEKNIIANIMQRGFYIE